jgi:hypothetical protein
MRGNSHVRFGAGDEETCLGNGARRFIPTLPKRGAALCLSSKARDQGKGSAQRNVAFISAIYRDSYP